MTLKNVRGFTRIMVSYPRDHIEDLDDDNDGILDVNDEDDDGDGVLDRDVSTPT